MEDIASVAGVFVLVVMFLVENVFLWKCSLLVGRGIEIANGREEFCGCGSVIVCLGSS